MGKLSEFRKARPTSSLTGEVMIKANDIEVLFGNNTYVVRFVDEQIHILIPALGMDEYWGDSYLGENEKQTIQNYRQRIRQADAMGEFALGEVLRKIIAEEQDHLMDLADALGIDAPKTGD